MSQTLTNTPLPDEVLISVVASDTGYPREIVSSVLSSFRRAQHIADYLSAAAPASPAAPVAPEASEAPKVINLNGEALISLPPQRSTTRALFTPSTGQWLRALRYAQSGRNGGRMSQTEMGEILGVPQKRISDWETDALDLTPAEWRSIAAKFGVQAPRFLLRKQTGRKISALLDSLNASDDVVASVAGVSAASVYEWRRGRFTPSPEAQDKIIRHFGLPPNAFYFLN